VWLQLADMFGSSFFREHGDSPGPLWCAAIGRLTDDQIRTGLANLGNLGLRFPANLPMFIAECKRPPPRRRIKALPPPTDQEQKDNANKAWDQMEKLAGRSLRPSDE